MARAHGADDLQEAAAGWPFFDALLGDVEMVLAKADPGIAEMYAGLATPGCRAVFQDLTDEYDRTMAAILHIRESSALRESDPTLQPLIRPRNPTSTR